MDQPVHPAVQLVKEQEAARILAVTVSSLRRWRREQRGPAFIKVERSVRYDLRALERYVKLSSSPQYEPTPLR